ncbi:hypothetical protein LJC11_00310 [Bacteroidales bacterium OttesenSCG-928-I21]|nr:hypothetical protein [Bacteroidales bacterium OttesenSCG-928-I21]
MKNRTAKLLLFFAFTILLTFISGCSENDDRIPYSYVNVVIYPDLPAYSEIKTPMNHIYLDQKDFMYCGYAGIIVYCEQIDMYKAYERNCPHNPHNKNAILDVDSTNLFMVCRDCGSKFSILYGDKVDGPAKYPVVQYKTELRYNRSLYISNY